MCHRAQVGFDGSTGRFVGGNVGFADFSCGNWMASRFVCGCVCLCSEFGMAATKCDIWSADFGWSTSLRTTSTRHHHGKWNFSSPRWRPCHSSAGIERQETYLLQCHVEKKQSWLWIRSPSCYRCGHYYRLHDHGAGLVWGRSSPRTGAYHSKFANVKEDPGILQHSRWSARVYSAPQSTGHPCRSLQRSNCSAKASGDLEQFHP